MKTGLRCLWCEDPMPGPLALRICRTCAPLGDILYHCTAGKNHLPTFSSLSCGQCDENAARIVRVRARVEPEIESMRKMRADHIRDWNKPWPGMNFAKAIVGRMIDAVISDYEAEIRAVEKMAERIEPEPRAYGEV